MPHGKAFIPPLDWAIHVTNEAIWQCNGLELDAMDPLLAIIHYSVVCRV